MTPDIKVEHHGSVALLDPQTDEGRDWLEEHTDGMWFGGALAVEPRYLLDVLLAVEEAGLEIGS